MKLIMEGWRKFLKEDDPNARRRKELQKKPWWQNIRDLDLELLDTPGMNLGMADFGLGKAARIGKILATLAKGSRLGKIRKYTAVAPQRGAPQWIHFPKSFEPEFRMLKKFPSGATHKTNSQFIDRLNAALSGHSAGFTYIIPRTATGAKGPPELVFKFGGDKKALKILKDIAAEYNIVINGLPL
jgi:hypothetical protein